MRLIASFSCLGACALLLAACSGSEPAEDVEVGDALADDVDTAEAPEDDEGGGDVELQSITFGAFGIHADYMPLYIAEAEGFFADEGLEVDFVVPDGGALAPALLSGSVDMASGTPDGFMTVRGLGEDVTAILSLRNQPTHSLLGGQGVETAEDVRGELVAVSNPLSGDAFLTSAMLDELGLAQGDYDMLSTGGTPDRAAALESGGVAAALIGQPQDYALIEAGYVLLDTSDSAVSDFAWQWVVTETEWAEANTEAVAAFVRAVQTAVDWWYEPANEDRAVEIMVEYTETSQDAAAHTYELWQEREAFVRDLAPTEAAMEAVAAFMESSGQLEEAGLDTAPSFEEFVDLRYLGG